MGGMCPRPAGSQALCLLLTALLLPPRLFLGLQGALQALTFHTCVSLKEHTSEGDKPSWCRPGGKELLLANRQ